MEVFLLTDADEGLIGDEKVSDIAWTMLLTGSPYQTLEGAKEAAEIERKDAIDSDTLTPLSWEDWTEPNRSSDMLAAWKATDADTGTTYVIRHVRVGA